MNVAVPTVLGLVVAGSAVLSHKVLETKKTLQSDGTYAESTEQVRKPYVHYKEFVLALVIAGIVYGANRVVAGPKLVSTVSFYVMASILSGFAWILLGIVIIYVAMFLIFALAAERLR